MRHGVKKEKYSESPNKQNILVFVYVDPVYACFCVNPLRKTQLAHCSWLQSRTLFSVSFADSHETQQAIKLRNHLVETQIHSKLSQKVDLKWPPNLRTLERQSVVHYINSLTLTEAKW